MRRTSLIAPLLLIAVGALLLARNLYPDLPLTDYVARYWPYVLILWGALRIGEICYWAATSKPLPARGISGGEWVLIALLCLIGMGLRATKGTWRWWHERIPWTSIQAGGERLDECPVVETTLLCGPLPDGLGSVYEQNPHVHYIGPGKTDRLLCPLP